MPKNAGVNVSLVKQAETSAILAAYLEFNNLKQIYRQGWLNRGVPPEQCETVAEHILGVALLAWFVADQSFPTFNRDKLLRMALVHDLGEVFVGDLTPTDAVSPGEKRRREREAITQLVSRLPHGREYVELWEEYEAGRTNEARLVRQIDRLEMACQALIYEKQGFGAMEEFFRSASTAVYTPEVLSMLDMLKKLR